MLVAVSQLTVLTEDSKEDSVSVGTPLQTPHMVMPTIPMPHITNNGYKPLLGTEPSYQPFASKSLKQG